MHDSKPAIGAVGLEKSYKGVFPINVDNYFDTLVHFSYKNKFHEFAAHPESKFPPSSTFALTKQDHENLIS